MSNANTSKRLNAMIVAISALTVDDLESFTDEQVMNLRQLKRHAAYTCEDLEREVRRAKERAEQVKRDALEKKEREARGAAFAHLPTPVGLSDLEWENVKNGKKIIAIKYVRERTGCSLADAKCHVEQVSHNVGMRDDYTKNHGLDVENLSVARFPWPRPGSLSSYNA